MKSHLIRWFAIGCEEEEASRREKQVGALLAAALRDIEHQTGVTWIMDEFTDEAIKIVRPEPAHAE